jgi:alpha-beta hydrolase superfamily lysophospholipase
MPAAAAQWTPDPELGAGFVQTSLRFPDDYEGAVTATVVRNDPMAPAARGAVLYVHGFIDYFFQRHVAEAFVDAGFNFYAVDLRKHGRSLGEARRPNFCLSLEEYFPEITAAIDLITEGEGRERVVLYGHSTGALTSALYTKGGARRDRISTLILNSPFFDFREPHALTGIAAAIGRVAPFRVKKTTMNPWYARSIHVDHRGEWRFNTAFKPLDGFPVYYGWIRAIFIGQRLVARGLDLAAPVLVLHSDKSLGGSAWSEGFHRADLILDVEDMKRIGPTLGRKVVVREIAGGRHDLVLSVPDVRRTVLETMLDWVDGAP